jgi:hypothetical protein
VFIGTIMALPSISTSTPQYTFCVYYNGTQQYKQPLTTGEQDQYINVVKTAVDNFFNKIQEEQFLDIVFELTKGLNSKYSRIMNTYIGSDKDIQRCREEYLNIVDDLFSIVRRGEDLDITEYADPDCIIYLIGFLGNTGKLCLNYENSVLATYISRYLLVLHLCIAMTSVFKRNPQHETDRGVGIAYQVNHATQTPIVELWKVSTDYKKYIDGMRTVCNIIVKDGLENFTVDTPEILLEHGDTGAKTQIVEKASGEMTFNRIPEFILNFAEYAKNEKNIRVHINTGASNTKIRTSDIFTEMTTNRDSFTNFVLFMLEHLTEYFISRVTEHPDVLERHMGEDKMEKYIP